MQATEVDAAPYFTAEDERRERSRLTAADVLRIESDLRGLALDDTNESSAAGGAAALLARLDEEMGRLERGNVDSRSTCSSSSSSTGSPSAATDDDWPSTAAYRRAQRQCPEQLSPDRLLAFLETERNDPAAAARRLARYWTYRLDLFGPDRCYRPLTLLPGGAMEAEAANLSVRRIFEAMPNAAIVDDAGRSIVHCVPSRRNFDQYTVAQEMQALFYIVETILQSPDPARRRAGIVALMDGRDVGRRHFSSQMARYAGIWDALPIEMRAHHLCHPSAVQRYVLVPASKFFSPPGPRLRFVMHCGTEEEVVQALGRYRLPRRCLPTSLGGTVVLDMHRWVLDRLNLEQQQQQALQFQQALQLQQAVGVAARMESSPLSPNGAHDDSTCNTGPMTKRVKTNVPSGTDSSGAAGSGRLTGRGAGRGRPDRRMKRALELKLANPNMSLLDALVGGGFVFNDEQGGEVVDTDGVRLAQRKNNLLRRIRLEKEKLNKEGGKERTRTEKSTAQDQTSGEESEESGSSVEGHSNSTAHEGQSAQNVGDDAPRPMRRDSFDEAIESIPGIQEIIREEQMKRSNRNFTI